MNSAWEFQEVYKNVTASVTAVSLVTTDSNVAVITSTESISIITNHGHYHQGRSAGRSFFINTRKISTKNFVT